MKKKKSIPANHHVSIFGRTGSGKTYLARKYLAGYKNVVVLDTKGTTAWTEIPGTVWHENQEKYPGRLLEGGENLTLVEHLKDLPKVKTDKIIYRPVFEELNPDFYDSFFKFIYLRRNTIVWIDEAMSVSPNPYNIPPYYKACLTRGRELNIGVWSLSQRPSGIHQIIISEASHVFAFDLNMPQDREKIASVTGALEFLEKPGKYLFWYYYIEWDGAIKARLVEGKKP